MNENFKKWTARINWIKDEHQFGKLEMKRNEEGQLHCDDGPAYISPTRLISYKGGRKHGLDVDKWGSIAYFYENILVPPKFCLTPDKVTVEEVLTHPNQEIRYVGIKIIGFDRIKEKCEIVHQDDNGQELFRMTGVFEEPLCFVKVFNSTPELDGSKKIYFLIVPPEMKTCREAVAWTFRKEENDYSPSQET
jgi:hypothetical protein